MVSIRKHMAPLTRTSGRGNTKKYITIHETANRSRGAGARVHARLQAGTNSRQASWHYQVDDKEIVQSFDDSIKCWHAGGTANSQSIAIEICVNSDSDYNKALGNAAALVAHLRKKHGIPWNRVVSHNFWTGKNCPTIMLSRKGQWDKFIAATNPGSSSKVSTSSSKPAAKKLETAVNKVMETKRKNVKVYERNNTDSKVIGTMSGKGYDVHVIKTQGKSRSWAQIKWKGSTGWVVAKYLKDLPKGAKSKGSSKAWPYKRLKVNGKHTTASHNAWVKLMAAVGYKDKSLTTAMQRWLKGLGYYKGTLDTVFGTRTVKALQNFLKDKGLYKGYVDGDRGSMTVKSEHKYLNQQRKYLK